MNNKTQKTALSGVMIALSVILSFVTIYRLPYGGAITLFSMVPILLVGYIYGAKWGIITGLVYGVIQAVSGAVGSQAFAGLDVGSVLLVCLLDYLVAFGVLGVAGMLKMRIKSVPVSFGIGVFFATLLRYATHFLSGYIVYGSYAEWFFSQEEVVFGQAILDAYSGKMLAAIYSLIYNATYMIPEIILSVIIGVFVVNLPPIKKICIKSIKDIKKQLEE